LTGAAAASGGAAGLSDAELARLWGTNVLRVLQAAQERAVTPPP